MIELYGYDKLIEDFINKKISAEEFENSYREIFLNDGRDIDDSVFLLLDELFVFVYGYTENPELIKLSPDYHFNENQLRESAAKALQELRSLNDV